MSKLEEIVADAFDRHAELGAEEMSMRVEPAVREALAALERGEARVAERDAAGSWRVNTWLKQAVLLSFRLYGNQLMPGAPAPFWDKVPLRHEGWGGAEFAAAGMRVVPGAIVRRGAHVAKNVVLMPSFVNIGAWIGEGSMVDTWATVGSCAQIGARVHLSGGVGIGGVLEPLQAAPTIIEDDCFIGARSEIVEGVIVERGSVIGMGVFIGQSTRIYDRATGEVHQGRVPAGSVVVSGSLPAADGSHSLACAVIVKRVDERTRSKTSINELLRA